MGMKGLGRAFDIQPNFAPVDINTAGAVGLPVDLSNAGGVTFVVYAGAAASGADALVLTLREAQDGAATGEQDLDVVTEYFIKKEATLDGDETWEKVTQSAGDITVAAADRDKQIILAFYVDADDLSDGFTHVAVDTPDSVAVARLVASLAILHDLKVQRAPENLPAAQ
jgi:hypothetical protein